MLWTTCYHPFTRYFISSVLLIICATLTESALAGYPGDDRSYDFSRGAKFWIGDSGPSGPIFTGPQQYPFICTTAEEENALGQPLIDNQQGIGNAVFPEINGIPDSTANPIGYSQLCSIATRVDYFYFSSTANKFLPLADPTNVPADVEQISIDDQTVNFVVRVERGTINRFIYSIAMLAPYPESLKKPRTLNDSS